MTKSSTSSNSDSPPPPPACWTCRRRRVRCDGNTPTCLKCIKAGKECLGYKKPLVWNHGVASRGKMMGKTYHKPEEKRENQISTLHVESNGSLTEISGPGTPSSQDGETEEVVRAVIPNTSIYHPHGVLVDPIFQDFKPITRYYLDYYVNKLCIEAVLHDLPGQNPFRDLISTVGNSPLLLKSMLAAAARHITNYTHYSTSFSPSWVSNTNDASQQLESISESSRYHALWYKQVALAQLRKDLEQSSRTGVENDVIVASISLFIWIDLLEAGKNTWRIHLEGMKRLVGLKNSSEGMKRLTGQEDASEISSLSTSASQLSTLGDDYASASVTAHPFFFDTCITFDVMGTTLSRPYKIGKPLPPTPTVHHSLLRAEKISFIGCPAELLYLILIINWKCWSLNAPSEATDESPSTTHFKHSKYEEENHTNASILSRIQSFNPRLWAESTTAYIPEPDTQERVHLAFAYQCAILIYFHRVLEPILTLSPPDLQYDPLDLDVLPLTLPAIAQSTLKHLSLIPPTHPFIKCILWPTFIAGAELISIPLPSPASPPTSFPHSQPSMAPTTSSSLSVMLHPEAQHFTDPTSYRDLTRQLLHTFWIGYRSVNVINAAGVLEEIWRNHDALSRKMSREEYDEHERGGMWSRGVLNCVDVLGDEDGSDGMLEGNNNNTEANNSEGGNGLQLQYPAQRQQGRALDLRNERGGWKEYWVGGDVDWLFV